MRPAVSAFVLKVHVRGVGLEVNIKDTIDFILYLD